jgi:transcriptional regulator with XRE-family HTH domain
MLLNAEQSNARMIAAGRMLAGLDQRGLAHASKVSASTISNIETGKTKASRDHLIAIQEALRMNGVTLTNDTDNGRILLSITYMPERIDIQKFVY